MAKNDESIKADYTFVGEYLLTHPVLVEEGAPPLTEEAQAAELEVAIKALANVAAKAAEASS